MTPTKNDKDPKNSGQDPNLAEEVLRQGGKSEDEVRRTGTIDRADDQVEKLFKFSTAASPVHRAVWEGATPLPLFQSAHLNLGESCQDAMKKCVEIVARHRVAGTLFDDNNKVSTQVISDLAAAGYWGMLIDREYGGQGASLRSFMSFLTQMSGKGDPTTAGLASIHGCIGAVDPLSAFGSDEQKKYFLPILASGKKISGFGLTERNAGSDLTALRTTAVADGDDYLITGEKFFISNAIHGRIVGLVCLVEGKPAVFIVELPETDTETFAVINYGLHPLQHTFNNGLSFKNFRVPKGALLHTDLGDGLTIAYHGLNRGRVALCANAAGVMRILLRSITPESWGKFRETYGQAIEKRELVQFRIAQLAGLIVGADALVSWCASLLDEGYRGELECIIAKVFGSEAQWKAATDYAMITHGGRSMLKGHLIGDNIHDYAAPRIYEGEGEMLSMALFKSLAKEHGMSYMLPVGNAMMGMMKAFKKGNIVEGLKNLVGFLWQGARYTLWQLGKRIPGFNKSVKGIDKRLARHVKFAQKMFRKLPLELSTNMVKHQLKLADRQCRLNDMSMRVQKTVTILVAALYAHQLGDDATIAAADVLCQRLRMELTGELPSDAYFKACSKLGQLVIEGRFAQLDGIPETRVLQTYTK